MGRAGVFETGITTAVRIKTKWNTERNTPNKSLMKSPKQVAVLFANEGGVACSGGHQCMHQPQT